MDTPYPEGTSQHVRGIQSSFATQPLQMKRRLRVRDHNPLSDHHLLPFEYTIAPDQPSLSENIPNNTPVHHKTTYVMKTHLENVAQQAHLHSHDLWTDKYRPRRAEHVLGNESHALYLRDWLLALELQLEHSFVDVSPETRTEHGKLKQNIKKDDRGLKRPRVIRSVMKQRGRKKQRTDSDEEDWIVGSDESEEESAVESDRETGGGNDSEDFTMPLTRLRRGRSPELDPADTVKRPPANDFRTEVTNTILLHCPSGSGKTAAIYACAEELGFEVFEVYPGVGKRNASNLDHLVGNVGTNHLVRNKALPVETSNAIPSIFGRSNRTAKSPELAHNGHSEGIKPKQSLILLEEADILFKEDSGFWPAVVKIIKDCRRPVIITCNGTSIPLNIAAFMTHLHLDINLIPMEDLPLQKILSFDPCPIPQAASYLHSICQLEGLTISDEDAFKVYQDTCSLEEVDMPDSPLHPFTAVSPFPDLRRAINHLQFRKFTNYQPQGLVRSSDRWMTEHTLEDSMSQMFSRMDTASFVDSHLSPMQIDTVSCILVLSFKSP